uniref:ADP-ribose pyrophosphatase, mitochondrial n=2 Tax=Eptatretus burgeri TaxID=7764 RepID=A0A8C4QCX7_EPTBU
MLSACNRLQVRHLLLTMPLVSHVKARGKLYPGTSISRQPVPDDKVAWSVPFPEYCPPSYTTPVVLQMPAWADPDYSTFANWNVTPPKYNQLDGSVERRSHTGEYMVIENIPRNPCGRTGLLGRGLLGKWGPNHAADSVVTRWKWIDGKVAKKDGKPVMQFVAIQRRDCGEWALPGGMVDPGEQIAATVKREFCEEAMNSLSLTKDERHKLQELISTIFQHGEMIYKGYVDDPRNTDNAWMETVAFNFHDETNDSIGCLPLRAGDDAKNVAWLDVDKEQALYANHSMLLQNVAHLKQAHW